MPAPERNRAQPLQQSAPRRPVEQRQNVSATTQQIRAASQAQQTAQRRLAGANRQAEIERAAGINTRVSPTLQATANRAGFAPGSRPGVITVSGSSVFKNGKSVGSFGTPGSAEGAQRAQAWAQEITAPGQGGRQVNIMGDQRGETYRQLYQVNPGPQTGLARTGAALDAIASRGFAPQVGSVNGQETVLGGINQSQARQSVNYPTISPVTFGEPTQRNIEAERAARQEIVSQQGGTSLSDFSPGQIALMQEEVNQKVYGSPNPSFTAQTPQPTEPSAPEITPDETAATVDSTLARGFTDTQFVEIEKSLQETTDSATESVNELANSDPDILAAEELGEDTQNMLEQRQQQLLEQYNQLVANLQNTYTAQEADYKEQAADQMANAISQLAAIGAYGTSTAGIQFVDQLSRRQNAQLLALNANRATALTSAFEAYGNADFELATRMIDEAKGTQDTIRQIKEQQIQRQRELIELKQLERENVGDTITNMAAAGLTADRLPPGYLTSLDAKGGYAPGTSAGLLEMAQKERQQLDEKQQLEQAKGMVDFLTSIPAGQTITLNGVDYTSLSKGDIVHGTEDDGNGNLTIWTYNKDTGDFTTKTLQGVSKKDGWDFKVENGVGLAFNPNTQEYKVMFDTNSPAGADGLYQMFPEGTQGGQCGRFVNELTGLGVGDSFESKMAKTDPSIGTAQNPPRPGDVFMQPYSWTGHTGIVAGVTPMPDGSYQLDIVDSNFGLDEKIQHRQINSRNVSGFARPGLKPEYSFGSDSLSTFTGGGPTNPETEKLVVDLRKEFQGLAQTKEYQTANTAYSRVEQAASQDTPAGDLALIYSYMKILDPGSVVREGEFATAQNAASVPDRIRNAYNKVVQGTRLTQEQRNDYLGQAKSQYSAYQNSFRSTYDFYRSEAERQGIDPNRILGGITVETTEPSTGPVNGISNYSEIKPIIDLYRGILSEEQINQIISELQ